MLAPFRCPAGKLDAELVAATRRVSGMLQKLPREITPVRSGGPHCRPSVHGMGCGVAGGERLLPPAVLLQRQRLQLRCVYGGRRPPSRLADAHAS